MALNENKLTIDDVESQDQAGDDFNYSQRAQWLRAAVLGANDGLVSTASLIMGVGAVKADAKTMLISSFAGLVAGACSMAIGEFVSVYSQCDIEMAQMKRNQQKDSEGENNEEVSENRLQSPVRAALASALAFSAGALVPLLAAGFISSYKVRMGVVVAAASVTLVVFGWTGAVLGRAPVLRSCGRVLLGGWLAMGVTFGMLKLFGSWGF